MDCDNTRASSSQSSSLTGQRKKKDISKLIYSVAKFNTEYEEDEIYSVIPSIWLKDDDKYTYWPKKDTRNCIIKRKKPQNDWILHPVTVLAKYDLYEHALQKEKRLIEEKSNTESESQLGRGFRKKTISHRISNGNVLEHNSSDTSCENDQTSDKDSIPELNENLLNEQGDDVNHDINQIMDNASQIINLNDIPILIQEKNGALLKNDISTDNYDTETLNSILKNVLEIKRMCRRIDERLGILENNRNMNVNHNVDMLPPLPLDCFEDINNFEVILVSEEVQLQLVNMLTMIGGTTKKDAVKRALQKLFTNNLASKCFWTGAKNNFTLKDLKLIMCMKNAIKNTCPTITDAQFEENLKLWFRQANLQLHRENERKERNNNARNNV